MRVSNAFSALPNSLLRMKASEMRLARLQGRRCRTLPLTLLEPPRNAFIQRDVHALFSHHAKHRFEALVVR